MSVPSAQWRRLRERSNFACEFCGVSESDAGGLLTVDHFRPRTQGGTDDLDNLVYCCIRCNQYKQDYWPSNRQQPALWNPRDSDVASHFVELENGWLHPLTPAGAFTLSRLRLNRPPLVAWRLQRRYRQEQARLLANYRELVHLLERLRQQESRLLQEQQKLLFEQRALLRLLVKRS